MLIGLVTTIACSVRPEGVVGELTLGDWAQIDGAVVRPVGRDAVIDWTNLQLRVTDGASGGRSRSVTYVMVEDSARSMVERLYRERVERVPIDATRDLGDVMVGEIGELTLSRIPRWEVVQATYTTSGRVELVGELSLQTLLKPWFLSMARPGAAPPSEWDAIVIDARGFDVQPTYLQTLSAEDGGAPLYAGQMWEEQAVGLAPFAFVEDQAAAFARIAASRGKEPETVHVLELRATAVTEDQIRLDAESVRRVRESGPVLGAGTVFVVMDGD